ncbi:helix-turn-helix transcriptional regulator [candidate division KSB1 bacterium]|nr:helix-turn-helix transcriptional regulator [candidate division KSB1 bacterium]
MMEHFDRDWRASGPDRTATYTNLDLAALEVHMGEEDFGVEELAVAVAMSRSQIHRKLQALTGQNCGQFMLSVR